MWVWNQLTGRMYDDSEKLVGVGYSGYGQGKNNPSLQAAADLGPIPCGRYTIDHPRDTDTHGPYVLPLNPHVDNVMFGRAGFLIHGDAKAHIGSASEGCIILSRDVRKLIWESGDHELIVVSGLLGTDVDSEISV